MLHFASDYMEGAHPKILQRLLETNMEQTPGYGADAYCVRAKEKIRQACGCPAAEVFFLVGGTQTNAAVIDGVLKSWQGVLAADTGHINTHEAGAIEAGGHKVLTLPSVEGKVEPDAVRAYLAAFFSDENREHMVEPGMLYLSHPTEYGTLYSGEELRELSQICRTSGICLYVDGARLGYGLAAGDTDVTLQTLAETCDAFYIGGTKVGALFGEALVIPNRNILKRFFTLMKQHGALLAKGRLLGLQFDTLFTDDLYLEISRHALRMARKLQEGFGKAGYALYLDAPTNQVFVILDQKQKERLEPLVEFAFWEALGEERMVVRFATSWATKEEDVDALLKLL